MNSLRCLYKQRISLHALLLRPAGNLVKTVTPKGVIPNYTTSFLNDVTTERNKMLAGQSWSPVVSPSA